METKELTWLLAGDEYTAPTDRRLDDREGAWLSAGGVIVRDHRYVVYCVTDDDNESIVAGDSPVEEWRQAATLEAHN